MSSGVAGGPIPARERLIVSVLVLTQFINILEFMIVMPLGPEFARDLGFGPSQVGVLGAAYTGAAAVAGVVGSRILDRFDRRVVLAVLLALLGLATAAAAGATSLWTLLIARVAAGLSGGPASSMALAIVADTVPIERRGRAMGAIFGAFSVASVLGVPLALELAEHAGWRGMFLGLGGAAVALAAVAFRALPSLRDHLDQRARSVGSVADLGAPMRWGLLGTFVSTIGMFALVPNISTWVQANVGYPRDQLGFLYFVGGLSSLAANVVGGRGVDRAGAAPVGILGSLGQAAVIAAVFLPAQPRLSPVVFFVTLMAVNTLRVVALQTLCSRVPPPHLRASYNSWQSAVQHLGAGLGAYLASRMLSDGPGGILVGIDRVAWITVAGALLLPLIYVRLQAVLAMRDDRRAAPADQPST